MKFLFWIFAFAVSMSCVSAADEFPPVQELPLRPELPDPLTQFDGKPVFNKRDWFKKRRPELQELFQHYEYGYFPPPAKIRAKIKHIDKNFYDGKATLKLVTIAFDKAQMPPVNLMLVVPNQRKGKAPVFLGLNFSGNHSLVNDANVPLAHGWMNNRYIGVTNNRATEAARGTHIDTWAIEQSIDRGYAIATAQYGELEPDQPNMNEGLRAHLNYRPASKNYRPNGEHDWGAIAAWAWGLHRMIDFLVKEKDIDKKRIAVVGHSRLGKTALLAAAFDERIALVIPNQAGCGGTSPARRKVGESVKRINSSFPHWFCDEFKKFGVEPERLPFDQHCLIALCAPRPVLLSNALEDEWANPAGQFEMLQAADKVYRLVGADGVASQTMSPVGTLMDSTLGYSIREGKHSMTKGDWKIFLDFADKHFGEPR